MSPPPPVYNGLPIENIGQNVISHYFDHHPLVRGSFLEVVQRVAGRESLLTPVVTPTANALDEDPTESDSRKHTNLRVPVESAIVDGTVGPFIANNEHLDEPNNKCVEQAGKDDQPYLSAPPTASDDLAAVTPDFESSSINNPTQARTIPQEEAKRKRKRPIDSRDGAIILSKIPYNILEKWNMITGPEDLVQLRLDVCARRRSRSDEKPESTLKPSEPSEPSDPSI
ncbi:hypothetical protein BJ875DRAFT_488279 [Amylocarpus encephaloides]|uniref:Uncharacterized protein n=1 Tax=Amylocarpus encephaloides TaxID=45428 RepID=A0A9P8C1M7_9HELO|nr:hypothetical protein BJ875DRAFT_488279 [Amylocarpus encephaloides]